MSVGQSVTSKLRTSTAHASPRLRTEPAVIRLRAEPATRARGAQQHGGSLERLHRERVLRVAVVVGVALEALAERIVAIAQAAVRALRDVRERARRRRPM